MSIRRAFGIPNADQLPRRAPFALLVTLACACSSRHADVTAVAPAPVEECEQYEAALNACFHRDVEFAHQAAVLPASDADRERIKIVCSANLQRIRTACPSPPLARTP
jgi:hypothetical protein